MEQATQRGAQSFQLTSSSVVGPAVLIGDTMTNAKLGEAGRKAIWNFSPGLLDHLDHPIHLLSPGSHPEVPQRRWTMDTMDGRWR